ncbi:hypothetical protein BJX63DRAFT_247942 [Aspergillus granulosus]|uniref:Ubiquitin-like domain-containing protein n=1 Tax=Aspergillus granulosus TaxID=176169 RepID=A0ABR4HAA4_9EURO
MAVGFGFSAGDFVAALKLVKTVIDALRESSQASTSFCSLINELHALESAIIRVKMLDLDELQYAEKTALQQAASQCQQTIGDFWSKVQKYQPHLQQRGTNSQLKDGWAKVKWALCKQADIKEFQRRIMGHTRSITLLLLTVNVGVTTIRQSKADSQHKDFSSKIENTSCRIIRTLISLADSVAQCVQQGKVLLEFGARIVQTNLCIFHEIRDMERYIHRIPEQIQRQQPVYMIDAFNNVCPFHLEFIQSAEAFLAVLKINLKKTSCGPEMIDRGDFVIEELGTNTLINITQQWDTCFYPGQRVAMSMVFRQKAEGSSCPRCKASHNESTGEEISCTTCGTVFRRIEELDIDSLPHQLE